MKWLEGLKERLGKAKVECLCGLVGCKKCYQLMNYQSHSRLDLENAVRLIEVAEKLVNGLQFEMTSETLELSKEWDRIVEEIEGGA